MFFSVLIPVYNTYKYLPECLDSVLSQTFTDFEVVLLDDGSKDDSGKLCDDYATKDSRVRVIHKQNEGLMMTRRRGFKEAKGNYFICVDSDDKLFDNHALEIIHNRILKTGSDLVLYDFVHGAVADEPETVREALDYPDGVVFDKEQKQLLYDRLLTTNRITSICSKCISREIVDIGTDYSVWKEDICRSEDAFQSLPIIDNAKRVTYVKRPLYYYRATPNSISYNVRPKYYYAYRCIDKRADEYIEKWDLSDDTKEKTYRVRVTGIMSVLVQSYYNSKKNNNVSVWKQFALSLSEDPFFQSLLMNCNKNRILKYYRMLHHLIIKKRINCAVLVIESTTRLSKLKRKIKG